MKRDTNSFISTLQIITLSSLSWVLGILIGLAVVGLGTPLNSELTLILTVGLLGGLFVATAQWLLLHDQINSYWVWLGLTCIGALVGVLVAGFGTVVSNNVWGWLVGGLLAGGLMGGFQSFGLARKGNEKLIHLIQSSLSWGAAFLIAYTLLDGSMSARPGSISLIASGIIGWGVLVLIGVWAIIWVAPTPKKSYPRGRIRWWY